MKRSPSRSSCPNAFTTRAAPSASCTTDRAELSSLLTSWDWCRRRRRVLRETRRMGGETASATRASRQLIRAVTATMAVNVRTEPMKGRTPSTAMFWMEVASYWMR